MASPPDASGGEQQASDGVRLRFVLPLLIVLMLAAAVYAGYEITRSYGGDSFTDLVSRYPPNTVTYLADGHAYVVRAADGTFLVLSEVEATSTDRVAGCVIRYRADLPVTDERGGFRDDCHGTLYNLQGIAVDGSAPAMQRHPVAVHDRALTVRFNVCLRGGGTTVEPCP